MSTAYVVLERSFDYNDETYEAESGGNVVRAFTSREDAEKFAIEKTIADFDSGNHYRYHYCYDPPLDDDLIDDKFKDLLEENCYYEREYEVFFDRWKDFSQDMKRAVAAAFHEHNAPYYVQEVELN